MEVLNKHEINQEKREHSSVIYDDYVMHSYCAYSQYLNRRTAQQ